MPFPHTSSLQIQFVANCDIWVEWIEITNVAVHSHAYKQANKVHALLPPQPSLANSTLCSLGCVSAGRTARIKKTVGLDPERAFPDFMQGEPTLAKHRNVSSFSWYCLKWIAFSVCQQVSWQICGIQTSDMSIVHCSADLSVEDVYWITFILLVQ